MSIGDTIWIDSGQHFQMMSLILRYMCMTQAQPRTSLGEKLCSIWPGEISKIAQKQKYLLWGCHTDFLLALSLDSSDWMPSWRLPTILRGTYWYKGSPSLAVAGSNEVPTWQKSVSKVLSCLGKIRTSCSTSLYFLPRGFLQDWLWDGDIWLKFVWRSKTWGRICMATAFCWGHHSDKQSDY